MLLKTGQKGDTHVMPGINAEYNRLKEECQVLRKKCEEMQDTITQLNSDNKELALCW
jgi:prefoldin subunit 5